MSKYLVTGAAGFIAARVVDMLLNDGHDIIGVDNMNDAYDVRMKEYRLSTLTGRPGFEFEKIDIADNQALLSLNDRTGPFDAIVNLAARAGVRASLQKPWVYLQTNVEGTLNLLELCRHNDISKFILASTSSIYGKDAPLPTPETAHSSRPLQPYAASKKAAEVMCYAYHALYGIDVTVFRYFTVYGPAGRPDMVMFRFIQWIKEGRKVIVNGDGEQSRGFTYLDDIARGTILGLKKVGYEIFNLGGHETIRINELVQLLESKIGREADAVHRPLHPADLRSNWADVNKAGHSLGWEPQVSIEAGVEAAVAWYTEERSWASQVDTSD
jgi:nucleoside-diphosphate-sugar epimerase